MAKEDKVSGAPATGTKTQKDKADYTGDIVDMAPATKRHSLKLPRFKQAEHVFNTFHVVPEPDTPFEALFDEAYWSHVCRQLKPWDRIVVDYMGDDGSYTAVLLVRDQTDVSARVTLISKTDLEVVIPGDDMKPSGYTVKYQDPHALYVVIRDKDNTKVNEGFPTKADAYRWIGQRKKVVAA